MKKLYTSSYVRCPELEAQGFTCADCCVSVDFCTSECPHYESYDKMKGMLVCNYDGSDV